MLGFSEIFNVTKFLSEKLSKWESFKREKIEKIYEDVVESSYRDLEAIHRDYSTQLSKLRDHIINKSLPPHELIQWLRQTGLEYRPNREALFTIEAELKRFGDKPINPNENIKSRFYWHLQKYVKAILDYLACTVSHIEFSFYRSYENRLSSLLNEIKNEKINNKFHSNKIARLFYDSDFVQDTHDELIRICDIILPEQWKKVNEQYRLLRATFREL